MAVTGKQTNRIPFSSSCPLDSIASNIRQYMTFAVLLTGNPVNALGKGIPFEVRLEQPNKETVAAMLEAERIAKDPSVKGYNDLDELFADLKR